MKFDLIAQETVITEKTYTIEAETLESAKRKLELMFENGTESFEDTKSENTTQDITFEIFTPEEYGFDPIPTDDDEDDDLDFDYGEDEDDYFDDEDENDTEIKDDFGYEREYAETNGISELSLRGWIAAETALDREIPYWLIEEMEASSEIPLDEMTNEELRTLFSNNLEE